MRINYRRRLFFYFAFTFAIFTIGIVVFEQSREKNFKRAALETKLDAYADIVNNALVVNQTKTKQQVADDLVNIFPYNIRITIIDSQGIVKYDNTVNNISELQNHSERPEIELASKNISASIIRTSESTNHDYLYYAKKYNDHYIRVAMPYDNHTQLLLKEDNLFFYFVLVFFMIMLILINAITGRFSKSISQLRDFVMSFETDEYLKYTFPKDELGDIGTKITESFQLLTDNKKKINLEREKLLQHVHSSEEGICFFSEDKKVEFYNGLFIRYLNILSDEPMSDPKIVFTDESFDEVNRFLSSNDDKYFETQIYKHGKIFSLRINVFEDKGFEIILNDITQQERTRKLKQEITGNIAHELRTPVTSIRGYLETIIETEISESQKDYFVKQAYNQTIVLSELMQDMSLITKMEEVPQSFRLEAVKISEILYLIKSDFSTALKDRSINISWDISEDIYVNGNRSLLTSIFRNLIENAIRYGGDNIDIVITIYKEDSDFYYFSFYDTGIGIPNEKHLSRLFERFYRINEGRTRDTGGSGLGLSIVRNAVSFHKGTITVRNREKGGLEFLFQLHK